MPTSLKKRPNIDPKLLKKVEKTMSMKKKQVIKTWSRRSTITPDFVGITFAVWLWITYLNLDKIIKGYFMRIRVLFVINKYDLIYFFLCF